jgi:GT2 family glycosyltransferase
MSEILELIQEENWTEAYTAFSQAISNGNLDENLCILGATIFEHMGQADAMYDTICCGLELNPRNYELYLMLGNYYAAQNPNQAYLSYENALYFSLKQGPEANDDAETIKEIMNSFANENSISVRNVSFILLSYNTLEYTQLCIQSIRNTCMEGSYEIVVIDNASTDGSVDWLREQEDIILAENKENVGFPAGCNQGIRLANKENDIFLLNNDTLMMINSLYLLRMGLYESPRHGATGAVTNYAGNMQISYNQGQNLEDYYSYAFKNNHPSKSPYEQKSMLIMFAMLIKRDVLNIVGDLDERFSPGNFEDNDYGARILEAGYQNILCWNCFIFHYGSKSFGKDAQAYVGLFERNRAKFLEKWGFEPKYYMHSRSEIVKLIDAPLDAPINVLEVGCGLGDTLASILHNYPNAQVHGIEIVESVAELGSAKFDIKCGNIETFKFTPDEQYDYIIFADVLEHLYDPYTVLKNMKGHLKTGGCILTSIPNIMNARIIYELLNGNFTYQDAGILDRTHIRFFTKDEIIRMFQAEGYTIDQMTSIIGKSESTQINPEFFNQICKLVGEDKKILFDTYQYLVRARI